VDQAPAITSASGVTFTAGTAGTFTVQTTGFPTPPTITKTGSLPSGVNFVDNSNGTATLSGNASTAGIFPITITANNGVAPNATQSFTLTVVASPVATHLQLTAVTTTVVAGATDNLTITALDASNNVVTTYTGPKSLTFTGAGISPSGQSPTVTPTTGAAVSFGTTTTVSFTNGVATVSAGKNGVMTLYKAETATITVSDGSINNNASPLVVTVRPRVAKRIAWTSLGASAGTLQTSCPFVCSWSGANNQTLTGHVSITDDFGNIEQNIGSGHTVTLTGVLKTPTPTSLAIPATGAATSATFTYKADAGSWSTDTLTASDSPDAYTSAVVNITH
jgi:hypothetical protein